MADKLRVAMIIQAYHPIIGGAERQLGTIAPLLKKQGLDIHILTRKYSGLPSFEEIDGIPVHRLPIPGPMPVASLSFTANGMALLGRLKPDVIHAHELLSPTTTAVGAKLLFGIPVVAKVLGGGAMGDISKLNRNPVSSLRVRTILKQVDRFITISSEIGSELAEAGVPSQKLVHIPNGVNTDRFKPVAGEEKGILRKELGLPDGLLGIYTGRLDEEKNVADLVSIWPAVRGKHPGASLVIVGSGSEAESIRRIAGEGIHFLGITADVAPFLQASDLFLLPSKREGLSNALLEALACGLPAVATDVGGNPELVHHGINGLLVKSGNKDDLAGAISSLFGDETRRKAMGIESRGFVLDNYRIEKTIERLIDLYNEVRRD